MSAIQLRLHGTVGRTTHRPIGHGAGRLLQRSLATLREWRRRSRDRQALAGLDARMLRDIGLTPGEAEFIINKPFWRE
jgi:uncharacterized protein YjiS (DUF1127 family)